MNRFIKILSLILALVFVMGSLAACQTPEDPSESTPSETPAETPAETEPPKEPLTLSAEYVVVRPDPCSEDVKTAAISIKEALAAATGANVTIKDDFLLPGTQPGQYEILVGLTNREESETVHGRLKYRDYSVSIEGNKLVVAAFSDEAILAAAD